MVDFVLTGDVTNVSGSLATTLKTVNANVGTFGSSSAVPIISVDAKGRITAVSTAAISGGGSGITALTGDVTATGPGSVAATLATVNANVGSFGSATQSLSITADAKGRITAISAQTITPAWTSITGKPTTLTGYGITNSMTRGQAYARALGLGAF